MRMRASGAGFISASLTALLALAPCGVLRADAESHGEPGKRVSLTPAERAEFESLLVLVGYSAAILLAAIAGGRVSARGTMTHVRTQVLMSLVAGFILGIAIYHLLPHSLEYIPGPGAVNKAVGWTMAGLILMVFLLRVFQFHQHDFSAEAGDYHHHGHDDGESVIPRRRLIGIGFGLGVHTVTEGVALSDLLPEIHFHSHDRGKLILALVVGIGLAYALRLVEAAAAHGVEGH